MLGVWRKGPSCLVGGISLVQPSQKTVWTLKTFQIELPKAQQSHSQGHTAKGEEAYMSGDVWSPEFSAAPFTIAKKWTQPE